MVFFGQEDVSAQTERVQNGVLQAKKTAATVLPTDRKKKRVTVFSPRRCVNGRRWPLLFAGGCWQVCDSPPTRKHKDVRGWTVAHEWTEWTGSVV